MYINLIVVCIMRVNSESIECPWIETVAAEALWMFDAHSLFEFSLALGHLQKTYQHITKTRQELLYSDKLLMERGFTQMQTKFFAEWNKRTVKSSSPNYTLPRNQESLQIPARITVQL